MRFQEILGQISKHEYMLVHVLPLQSRFSQLWPG